MPERNMAALSITGGGDQPTTTTLVGGSLFGFTRCESFAQRLLLADFVAKVG